MKDHGLVIIFIPNLRKMLVKSAVTLIVASIYSCMIENIQLLF